ncbi:hypothetical protein NA2_04951 [Nitratireductor pacificus pht-3B]|uniref:DUF3800 domain-containing protein n=2 Tax=Nitratireductor TaxID=245876 RepID=K2MHC1_9HYPH|nr:hypothetical protein NA2_04951 [Nitratireductor pacificus pht-3B]
MVIGGILLRSADAHKFSSAVSEIYKPYRWPESIQWKSTSKAKVEAYKAVIDLVAEWRYARRLDFGCIVFDSRKIDHDKYNESDPEKGFFKFLYQHHLKWSRHYGKSAKFRCFHGNMETGYDLSELHKCLNNSIKITLPVMRRPYIQVDFLPVKQTRCMQVADLLIGAVGYACNGKFESEPSTPRAEVYRYMKHVFAWPDWSAETVWPEFGFHIWHFRL